VAGRRTFRILTSSHQSGISSKNSNTHITYADYKSELLLTLEITKTPTQHERHEERDYIFVIYVPLYLYKHGISIKLQDVVFPEIETKAYNIGLVQSVFLRR